MAAPRLGAGLRALAAAGAVGPVMVIFVSSNLVNAGNLAFNVLFSRWMGPEVFGVLASVLTIKLAILGLLGALQIAVSHKVARADGDGAAALDRALAGLNRAAFVALWFALPVVMAALWLSGAGALVGQGSPALLMLLALSLPFAVPMSLLRGVAYGRLDVRHVLLSSNIEMLVRLVGAAVAWHAGLGLTGVVAALAVSIVAGWLPLAGLLRGAPVSAAAWQKLGQGLALAALPFALLQASQVVLLDADVILARMHLGAEEAGLVAALSLFQRIQFFACFGLASVLLPAVSRAAVAGHGTLRPALAVAALFVAVSALVLGAAFTMPETLVRGFVGAAFLPAAPLLATAAAASVAFTLSYLVATFLSALGDRWGIWLIALAGPVQLWAMSAAADSLASMLWAKLLCQLALATALLALAGWRVLRPARPALVFNPA